MAELRARPSLAPSFLSAPLLIAIACWSSMAHADVSTPLGDISGTVGLKTTRQAAGDIAAVLTTIAPLSGNVTTSGTGWSLDVPLSIMDAYPAVIYNSGYIIGGGVSVTGLPTFAAANGQQAGDISVTIEGTYSTTSYAFIMFNPDFANPDGHPSVSGNGTFSITRTLAELQAHDYNVVSWAGSYAGGSSAIINVTGFKLSQSVTAVPEPASAALMALGLVALGYAARGLRQS